MYIFAGFIPLSATAQNYKQTIRGMIFDRESQKPLTGVNISCETCKPAVGCASDSLGRFEMKVSVGRHVFSFTHVGYNSGTISNVEVGTGKVVILDVPLEERVYQANEISVRAENTRAINPVATVSVRSLKSQDASRYAGGYFDPSRMAANFPGVASGNSDDSNELVIRGNSPRGVLWRIEGIEIPNPNHFSSGQGATGGGYSSVSTNVLSGFDFFTGSFPAEYGNAYSGVLDLFLRKGNTENYEIAGGISVLGVEFSAEGPLDKEKGNSFMFDYRHADFSVLTKYNIIDDENLGIPPKTTDWAGKSSFKTAKAGTFDFFCIGGGSTAGDIASAGPEELSQGYDMDEFSERHSMSVVGVKQSMVLPDNKTYMRNTAAFTYDFNSNQNSIIDTSFHRTTTYYDYYEYMAFRFASLFNHKFNARHSFRFGGTFNYLWGDLFAHRLNNLAVYDTLMDTRDSGWHASGFIQWKYQTGRQLEVSPGLHFLASGINHEFLVEPRINLLLHLPKDQSLSFGSGIHSRIEPFSVYNYRVKISNTERAALNKGIKTTKAFHVTLGYNKNLGNHFRFGSEIYFQYLFDVPVNKNDNSLYSVLNLSYGLPDVTLENKGYGMNKGVELTLEKLFSDNYFFLVTASLFDSKYKTGSDVWYNTFYNTNYVLNVVGGKEFAMGRHRQNTFGLKIRGLFRGGFRYTPVSMEESVKKNKLVYDISKTYENKLPAFRRIDFGISYRLNKQKLAWTFMADIQNVMNIENILKRRFYLLNHQVATRDTKSFGMIPVFTVKIEKKIKP
ncbi:MAG: hypothetical protein A2W89_15285 [Bacteroidetes bacterium GWE2_42_39]|nr:MAG: hypothetical protein A2W89_15285 [Bacteroidetes bacterium GWE2_42_39]